MLSKNPVDKTYVDLTVSIFIFYEKPDFLNRLRTIQWQTFFENKRYRYLPISYVFFPEYAACSAGRPIGYLRGAAR